MLPAMHTDLFPQGLLPSRHTLLTPIVVLYGAKQSERFSPCSSFLTARHQIVYIEYRVSAATPHRAFPGLHEREMGSKNTLSTPPNPSHDSPSLHSRQLHIPLTLLPLPPLSPVHQCCTAGSPSHRLSLLSHALGQMPTPICNSLDKA